MDMPLAPLKKILRAPLDAVCLQMEILEESFSIKNKSKLTRFQLEIRKIREYTAHRNLFVNVPRKLLEPS